MGHGLSKNFIKSTCREIARKAERGNKLLEQGQALAQSGTALRKMLVDAGVTDAEINLTMAEAKAEEKVEKKTDAPAADPKAPKAA